MSGPRVRTDMVEVYIFRRGRTRAEFLQLRRTREPYAGTWHPIAGGIEDSETAIAAAVRETLEESGLDVRTAIGFWRLDRVHPFYMPEARGGEAIFMAPGFCAEVAPEWRPVLNDEHNAHRWVPLDAVGAHFMWGGQVRAVEEIAGSIIRPSPAREYLRIDLG